MIHRVFITLGPDCVAEGFYTLDGDKVTMVLRNGKPATLDDDEPITAIAAPGMVEPVARALARRIHKWVVGSSVPGFGRGESIGGRTVHAIEYEQEAFV